ncbi:MAG: hypothetical protein EA351_06840 [Gemmatimonadales bacterium]|nr:MAG: hypothetical protein EA351_06840 [Gemmatimonadales bacterium]
MSRAAIALCVGITAVFANGLDAQFVESPVLPRGAILLEAGSAHSQASRVFDGEGDTRSFAASLLGAPLSTGSFPGLADEEERLRALIDDPGRTLSMGVVRGRFDVDEQRTPLRLGWGVLDRVTVGATVPLVRRQHSSTLRIDPQGGNVGLNPAQGAGSGTVNSFRSEAGAALAEMTASVEAVCAEHGEDSSSCLEGQASISSVSAFLDLVGSAWDDALLFPLAGSDAGQALASRWAQVRSQLGMWNAEGPESLPLSTRPISASTFDAEFVGPTWGPAGFPTEGDEPLVEIGDVELHLAIGLLDGRELGRDARFRLRSALEISARLPTGPADSMALVTPMEPVRGYGGAGLRWITDILLDERAALLSEVEWWSFQDRELLLLGTDPTAPWNPEAARRIMSGAPGNLMRIRLTPRILLTPGLSLGAGWELRSTGEGHWDPVATGDAGGPAAPPATLAGTQRQRASVELRFAGWDVERFPSLAFPVELLGRASIAYSGSEGAPRDRRFEIGARVLRGAR